MLASALPLRALLMVGQIASNTVAGYLMMRLLAYHFGISAERDAFDIAYSIPFLLMTAGGLYFVQPVISAAFQKQRIASDGDPMGLFSMLITTFVILSVSLSLLAWLFRYRIIGALAPGFTPETAQLASELFVLLLPLVATLGVGTVISAVLIAYDVPVLAELCQLTSRVGFILFAYLSGPTLGLHAASWVLTLSSMIGLVALISVLICCSPVRFIGLRFPRNTVAWNLIKRLFGVIAATACSQGSMAVLRALYIELGPGYLAAFGFAMSIISPLTVLIGQPLSATFGLWLSDSMLDNVRFRKILLRLSYTTVTLCIPIAAALFLMSSNLINLLYGGGAFNDEAVQLVKIIFLPMVISIPFHVLNWILAAPLMARFPYNIFVYINLIGYSIQASFCFFLVEIYGVIGISIGYLVGVIALTVAGFTTALVFSRT